MGTDKNIKLHIVTDIKNTSPNLIFISFLQIFQDDACTCYGSQQQH